MIVQSQVMAEIFTSGTKRLEDYTWQEISDIAKTGNAPNVFSVGETKKLVLNGTVGTVELNNFEIYAFIIGFNHNEELENTNGSIHFQIGMSRDSLTGVEVAFVDSKLGSGETTFSDLYFNMKTYTDDGHNNTYGGWKRSHMRNLLGSENDPQNPDPLTFMSILPQDLRNVMIPVTKYSNNVGGAYVEGKSLITPTEDYLWLLSFYEYFSIADYGTDRGYVAPEEAEYSKQYDYYSLSKKNSPYVYNDLNKIVYDSALRSVNIPNGYSANYFFKTIGQNFSMTEFRANPAEAISYYSIAIAPCFAVGNKKTVKQLEDYTWAEISDIAKTGLAGDYFSIGDTKEIVLNGTAQSHAYDNESISVFIVGFNHNEELEETNGSITFQFGIKQDRFKEFAVALVDDNYGTNRSADQEGFVMNLPYEGSHNIGNVGGWEDSYMRKFVLGSDVISALSPKENSILSVMPEDLRTVMIPVAKYSDNKHIINSTNENNITKSFDFLWLPSMIEVTVERYQNNLNQYIHNSLNKYQKTYRYYETGGDHNRYKSNHIDHYAYWFTRTPSKGTYDLFLGRGTNNAMLSGGGPGTNADYSSGITPMFAVGNSLVEFDTSRKLNDYTWAEISEIAKAGTGKNYFSVGDTKLITINGTVGTASFDNYEVNVFIIGFNHNEELEQTNGSIHFQIGFTNKGYSNRMVGLHDNTVGQSNDSTVGDFIFNPYTPNTSKGAVGGWECSHLRLNILGAASETATSPRENTLLSCLPSDLRSVIIPVTKYTDNGGASGTVKYAKAITSTSDYLWLLSEKEIFGEEFKSSNITCNPFEKEKNIQYEYYQTYKYYIFYKYSSLSTSTYILLRSRPDRYNTSSTSVAGSDGNLTYTSYSNSGYSITPIFALGNSTNPTDRTAKKLNDYTWQEISEIAKTGNGSNYFSVGDWKEITLNGSITNEFVLDDYKVGAYIVGFNHNEEVEGTNGSIHFQIGKTTDSYPMGVDIGFDTNNYIDSFPAKNDENKFFCMERTKNGNQNSSINYGGWKNSYMRNEVLGSEDSPLEPRPDTFLNLLPEDLRTVMIPIIKYDNFVGDNYRTSGDYVYDKIPGSMMPTVNYLWLPSIYEIYTDEVIKARVKESEYINQKHYEYYQKDYVAKVRHDINKNGIPTIWTRTIDPTGYGSFRSAQYYSNTYESFANMNKTITPMFALGNSTINYTKKKELNDYTWQEISDIAKTGNAQSYFSVGDSKEIILNGKVGQRQFTDCHVRAFIIGFNHNEELEKTNGSIHFQIGASSERPYYPMGLEDGSYDASNNSNVGSFTMNHYVYYEDTKTYASNVGGWERSDMRNIVLGANSPSADTFINALPSDLRAVMIQVTKYTDNTGGNTDGTPEKVTATRDYLWLLSEFEVFGPLEYPFYSSDYGNPYEKDKQAQYEYYAKTGYTTFFRDISFYSSDSSTTSCWSRSPASGNNTGFVHSIPNGKSVYPSTRTMAIAPCFAVGQAI